MFSAFASYIWGSEEESNGEQPSISVEEIVEPDGDWIMIQSLSPSPDGDVLDKTGLKAGEAGAECTGVGMDESWFVTPPPCFTGDKKIKRGQIEGNVSRLENLLIEHPSMSVYQPQGAVKTPQGAVKTPQGGASNAKENQASSEPHTQQVNKALQPTAKATVSGQPLKRLKVLLERQPLDDLNKERKQSINRKSMKKSNLVNNKHHKSKRNKRQDMKVGKHVGMVGKRGT